MPKVKSASFIKLGRINVAAQTQAPSFTSPNPFLAFPSSAITGSIGDLARLFARGTEVPEEFYFASGLTLLGSACATELTLNTGMDVEPRLHTVLLGQSYEAKKSTAVKRMVHFFQEL